MTPSSNQNPEQIARDLIDKQLEQAGWLVQLKYLINLSAGKGVAIREYQTSSGPAYYVLFVDCRPAKDPLLLTITSQSLTQ
jgi:type I restriction enzyme R subunit